MFVRGCSRMGPFGGLQRPCCGPLWPGGIHAQGDSAVELRGISSV